MRVGAEIETEKLYCFFLTVTQNDLNLEHLVSHIECVFFKKVHATGIMDTQHYC